MTSTTIVSFRKNNISPLQWTLNIKVKTFYKSNEWFRQLEKSFRQRNGPELCQLIINVARSSGKIPEVSFMSS